MNCHGLDFEFEYFTLISKVSLISGSNRRTYWTWADKSKSLVGVWLVHIDMHIDVFAFVCMYVHHLYSHAAPFHFPACMFSSIVMTSSFILRRLLHLSLSSFTSL